LRWLKLLNRELCNLAHSFRCPEARDLDSMAKSKATMN